VFAVYPKREYLPARMQVFIEYLSHTLETTGREPLPHPGRSYPLLIALLNLLSVFAKLIDSPDAIFQRCP